MKSVLSFYSFYRIIVKFFYLKSLLDPVPKNEIQIFFSFLNHQITKHSYDLVFRILVLQKVYWEAIADCCGILAMKKSLEILKTGFQCAKCVLLSLKWQADPAFWEFIYLFITLEAPE